MPFDYSPTPKHFIIPNVGEAEGQEPRRRDIGNLTPTITGKGGGHLVVATIDPGNRRSTEG